MLMALLSVTLPALACPSTVVAKVEATMSQKYPIVGFLSLPGLAQVPSTMVVACTDEEAPSAWSDAVVRLMVTQHSDQSRYARRVMRRRTGEKESTQVSFVIQRSEYGRLRGECLLMELGGRLVSVEYDFALSPELGVVDRAEVVVTDLSDQRAIEP